jgi:hypothetical protein
MTDSVTASSGSEPNLASGDGLGVDADRKESVAYDTYRKVLGEKKKVQEELINLKEKISSFEREKRERSEAELNEKQEYKKLLELREQDLKKTSDELHGYKAQFEKLHKVAAFREALNGDVSEQYLASLFDPSEIIVDPATGDIDSMSVASYVDKFRKTYPDVIKPKRPGTGLPAEAPRTAGHLTYEEWLKLPAKEMRARMKEVIKTPLS